MAWIKDPTQADVHCMILLPSVFSCRAEETGAGDELNQSRVFVYSLM